MGLYKYGRDIPEFVRKYREDMGLTQLDLSMKMKTSPQYVSNVERGSNPNSIAFCKRLAPCIKDPVRKKFLMDLVAEAAVEDAYKKML